MPSIVVVGSINIDLVVRTPRLPERGETLRGAAFQTFPDGKGANQAVAAARQGASVAMVGCVGGDVFGEQMRSALEEAGVNARGIRAVPGISTGVVLIAVEDSGDNRIIIVPGANGQVSPAMVDAATPAFTSSGVLVAQLELPIPVVLRAAQVTHEQGMQVILNAAPAQPLGADLLRLVDYLVVNEIEAAMLAGLPASPPARAAEALRTSGVANVVVTLGAEGAILVGDPGHLTVPAFRVSVVDTTAAGDAFVGAFAAALIAGLPVGESLLRGNAAGALAVTRLGAPPSLPTRVETEEFLAVQGQEVER